MSSIKTISMKLFTIGVIISLLVGVVAGYFASSLSSPAAGVRALPSEIDIGYIHSGTAEISLAAPAVKMFTEDVNKFCADAGLPLKFVVLEENAQDSATTALEKYQDLLSRGVQIVVGLAWSSHCKACLPMANERKIPILSVGSAASSLAIANDYLFRAVTDTSQQVKVLKRLLVDSNTKAVIPAVTQEDVTIAIMQDLTKALPTGIEVYSSVPLDPSKQEFVGEFATVNTEYQAAVAKYGADYVSVLPIFVQAGPQILNSMVQYPALLNARGRVFGGDCGGTADIPQYAPDAASKLEFTCYDTSAPEFNSPNYQTWKERFVAIAGFQPNYHGFNTYDSLWIAAWSILSAKEYTGEAIAKVIPTMASQYYGLSGWYVLNEAGDRKYPLFTVYKIVEGKWVTTYLYDGLTDTLAPLSG